MSESLSSLNESTLAAKLFKLSAERAAAEQQTATEFKQTAAAVEEQFAAAQAKLSAAVRQDRAGTQRQFDAALAAAEGAFAKEKSQSDADYREICQRSAAHCSARDKKARRRHDEARWEANTVFEATRHQPQEQLDQIEKQLAGSAKRMAALDAEAQKFIVACRQTNILPPPSSPPTPPPAATANALDPAATAPPDATAAVPPVAVAPTPEELAATQAAAEQAAKEQAAADQKLAEEEAAAGLPDPFKRLQDCIAAATELSERVQQLALPKLFLGPGLAGIWGGVWVAAFGLAFWIAPGQWVGDLVAATVTTLFVGGGLTWWLYQLSRARLRAVYEPLRATLAEGATLRLRCQREARRICEQQRQRIFERRDRELTGAEAKFKETMAETAERREVESRQSKDNHQRLQIDIGERRETSLKTAREVYPPRLAAIEERYETELSKARRRYEAAKEECTKNYDDSWQQLARRWREGLADVRETAAAIQQRDAQLFPAWSDPRLSQQLPARAMPPAIRFGEFTLKMSEIPGGVVHDPRLQDDGPTEFTLPGLLEFPGHASLLLQAADEGRNVGVKTLQAVMLRLLTSIPPGKARFTIIDPVGLGENFAAFMHLADYDEALVTNRIWTEPQHIEQRLLDLTEQMENIIQKYLRNDFKTIDEYNAFAGEVAEPLRFLIVANFPANFSEAAARRLTSIAASGARCGVYTLILNDTKQPLPPRFDIQDIKRGSTTLVWKRDKFLWKHEAFEKFPLALDPPPPENVVTDVVRQMGDLAKDSRRVEVPFETIAPEPDQYWKGDTSRSITVALGRAGATKLQYMKLGRGTSQHVLVAGKTGSGKSTLLHALITNLALIYSPDEIELYLIDFKKGVEFKTYATQELPHARVIAIESEREFGLSVLQRLDVELKRRGDQFRSLGVQDLGGFRDAMPSQPLPRILLVVDEFHEIFVEDDKIAQDAALLLDRLVRQGRAFGIHVFLGSQTLGGAYSLARSTIGQMAVRIALQCSESDAHLILSEDNSAARLLSRPGEAIYNDANGLIEGNNPFQVVWLPDERREVYLRKIRQLAEERGYKPSGRRIVFEGNVPADLAKNTLLDELLDAPGWPAAVPESQGWLGEAIAIKDPTAALFRAQNGSNLLIIGQREEAALGLMAAALISLAAQHAPSEPDAAGAPAQTNSAKFYLFETGTPGIRESDSLARLSGVLPHHVHVAGRRDAPTVVAELAAEVERRQQLEEGSQPPIFLFVNDLARFRDLRRAENEYSFSSADEGPNTAKQFATILREGPLLRVHTIVWCDTLNNLNRTFDRQSLREFDMRVMFQMSASDSSNLIDTPAASKLGAHLALYYNEEEGRAERFRPYSVPVEAYLAHVQQQLRTARGPTSPDQMAL